MWRLKNDNTPATRALDSDSRPNEVRVHAAEEENAIEESLSRAVIYQIDERRRASRKKKGNFVSILDPRCQPFAILAAF